METSERNVCVDCGIASPETQTNFTLIGARHGWRLTKRIAPDATFVMEWRCPACWAVYKSTSHDDAPMSSRPSARETTLRPSVARPAILLVGEDRLGREMLVRALTTAGFDVHAVAPPGLLDALEPSTPIVVVDLKSENEALLDEIDDRCPTCRVIVRTNAPVVVGRARRRRYGVVSRDAPMEQLTAAILRAAMTDEG